MIQELDLSEKLILEQQGRKSFEEADKILNSLNYPNCDTHVHLAQRKAEVGLDPKNHLAFLNEQRDLYCPQTLYWRKRLYDLVSVYLAMGDAQTAWTLTLEDEFYGRNGQPEADIAIAKLRLDQGMDPEPQLERVMDNLGRVVNGVDKLQSDIWKEYKMFDLLLAAPVYRRAGLDERSFLKKAESVSKGNRVNSDHHFFQANLAEIYAAFGYIDKATGVLGQMKTQPSGDASYFKISALERIVGDLLSKEEIDKAIEITSQAESGLFRGKILAHILASFPAISNSDLWLNLILDSAHTPLNLYRQYADKTIVAPSEYDFIKQAECFGLIGSIVQKRGKDGAPYFGFALELASSIKDYSPVYRSIARSMSSAGLNPVPIWKLAAQKADFILALSEGIKTMGIDMDRVEYGDYMEELAKDMVEMGYYDLALETTKKGVEADTNLDHDPSKIVEIMADIGAHQIKRSGLTRRDF